MKLSIIIPALNSATTIKAQLDALAGQEWSDCWEVILADNGSTDETVSIFTSFQHVLPHLQMVDAREKRGAAFARNKGVIAASGESVAFIDSDDVVAPGWLAAVGDALKQFDFIASQFDVDVLNRDKNFRYGSGTQTTGLQKLWYPPYYPHAGGCGMGIKRALHLAVGGFDENMPSLEDTDYCIRVQQHGVPLRFVPEAVVYVRNRSAFKGIYKQAVSWGQYNTMLYKRYRPEGSCLKRPWHQYWQDWTKLLRRLVRGQWNAHTIYRLGWQIGLLKGAILYQSAPAVILTNAQLSIDGSSQIVESENGVAK